MTEATKKVVKKDLKPLTIKSSKDEIIEMARQPAKDQKLSEDFKQNDLMMNLFNKAVDLFSGTSTPSDSIDKSITFSDVIDGNEQRWEFVPSTAKLYDYVSGIGYDYGEIGGAKRFSEMAKGHVLYDLNQEEWLAWNGVRWVTLKGKKPAELFDLVNQIKVIVRAEQVSHKVNHDSGLIEGKEQNLLRSVESQRGISAILSASQGEKYLGKRVDHRNSVENVINVLNGEVDLETGTLEKHDKDHFFTKVVPTNYDSKAECPTFHKFLMTTFNHDKQLIDWVQMLFGLSLWGRNIGQHFFIFYGKKGREGKSIMTDVIAQILGSDKRDGSGFGTSAKSNLFTKSSFKDSGESATPAMAALADERVVTTTEPDNADQFSEGIVKSLTGDDDITVRKLNSDPFVMKPAFTIMINANSIPGSDGSPAVMRRIVILPFDHQVAEGSLEDDPNIKEKLLKEREGILNWMVQGSVKATQKVKKAAALKVELEKKLKAGEIKEVPLVHQDALKPFPPLVQQAMLQYRFGANPATRFIFESLVGKREAWNFLSSTIWNCYDPLDINSKAEQYFDHSSLTGMAIEALGLPKVICDKQSYVRTHELYRAFITWCEQTGTNYKGIDEPNFNKLLTGIFPKARTSAGTVWLGIGLLPYIGKKKTIYEEIRGTYTPAIGEIGNAIIVNAKNLKYDIDCEAIIERLKPSKHTTSGQRQKIEDFIKHDGVMAFGGKYHDDTVTLINPNEK